MNLTNVKRIAVIGGGPTGLAAAILLRRKGFECCLVEKDDWTGFRPGEHLGPEAFEYLSVLDPEMRDPLSLPGRACSGIDMVWGDDRLQANDALFNPYGEGRILARPEFDARLAEQAAAEGCMLMPETLLSDVRRTGDSFQLSLKMKTGSVQEPADFILDASGRTARAARLLGARLMRYDRMIGLGRTYTSPETPPTFRGLIEATPTGWFFSVPLPGGGIAAYFMTDPGEKAPASTAAWEDRLKQAPHTAAKLSCLPGGEIHARPAHSQTLSRLFGEGWMATGDAAISFDPLSSAGISKGLESAFQAVDALVEYVQGDSGSLLRYESRAREKFTEYLRARQFFYRQESRWQDSPFWRRRRMLPGAGMLHIAPDDVVQAEGVPEDWHWRFGHLGGEKLLERAAMGGTAAEVLKAHKQWLRSDAFDTELVAALSALQA